LTHNFLLPGYVAYPNTAAASLYPTNADVADLAHAQGGLVGYVHPFDGIPDPAGDASLTNELPVDVALGKVDYIEVVGFSDHKSTAEVWYKLLNLGFRLTAAAGTDFMGNYASLRGPAGLNRVYAEVAASKAGKALTIEPWLAALKAGHTFASNGPLLRFSIGGQPIGGDLRLESGQQVHFSAELFSIVPVDHLQIVCNGRIVQELKLDASRTAAHVDGSVAIANSGWCVLRAFSDQAEYPILDIYPYATTSPIYINVARAPLNRRNEGEYFLAWIDRLISAAQANAYYNSEAEKVSVLETLNEARKKYENLSK
jgi:hypothetical protein